MNWKRANELFDVAIQLRAEAREGFLKTACNDDEQLMGCVLRLLSVDDCAGHTTSDFLPHINLRVEENTVVDSTVGSYRIARRIGHGGMGGVYLAHRCDDVFQKTVAIKILNHGLDSDRFKFERQVLAKLEHPNIARLLDGGSIADGRPFVVMEYVNGTHIDDYVVAQQLTIGQRIALFCELCKGVEHAHKNLIVHRDLKPANVLVSDQGIVKLLDFGIAKLIGEDQSLAPAVTHSFARPMTPDYASPEQIFSEPITTQSDVYSLGILLYKVLTGTNPNSNVKLRDRVESFAHNARLLPPSRATAGHNVVQSLSRVQRDDIDRIVAKATFPTTGHRYESVRQLRADLENFVNDRPIVARGPSPLYRGAKFLRRNPVIGYAMVLIALLLGIFSILTFRQNHELRVERDTSAFLTQVLLDALSSTDPVRGNGTIDVEQALANLTRLTDDQLADNTLSAFRIRLKVGSLQMQYGQYDAARRQLEAARAQAGQQDIRPELLAQMHLGLAFVDLVQGQFEDAVANVEFADGFLARLAPDRARPDLELTAVVYRARAQYRLGQVVAAKLAYSRALEHSHRQYGPNHMTHGELLLEYAGVLESLGQQAAAERYYNQAMAIAPGVQPTATSWFSLVRGLANYRLGSKDYAGARDLFLEGYAGAVRTYGRESIHAATMIGGAGSAHFRLGEYDQAERYYRQALDIAIANYGIASVSAVRRSLNLAQALKLQGQHEQAINVLETSIRAHQQSDAALKNEDVPFYLLVLARINRDAGRVQAAIAHYSESLDLQIYRADSADKRSEVSSAECELAALVSQAGTAAGAGLPDAQLLFRRCLPVLASTYGRDSHHYQAASHAARMTGSLP